MPQSEEIFDSEERALEKTETENKTSFIRGFESLILSGKYRAGDKIPAERELSKSYRISRPIIHEGLLDLARKGFVTISPRRGTFVNDFRKLGSPELLASLFTFSEGKLSRKMYESLLDFRLLFEVEAVRKAVQCKTDADLGYLKSLIAEEGEFLESMAEGFSPLHPAGAADLDFRFHSALMMASGNEVYPMLFNSFKKISMAILERHFHEAGAVMPIFSLHRELVGRIDAGDDAGAVKAMRDILMTSSDGAPGTLSERQA